jgi:hypothetical protein
MGDHGVHAEIDEHRVHGVCEYGVLEMGEHGVTEMVEHRVHGNMKY